jgi:hypothetical protein
MDQNSLFELVANYGEVYGTALPRENYLLKTIDRPDNWLEITDIVGVERAQILAKGEDMPLALEMQALIAWQVEHALMLADTTVTPVIWLCSLHDTSEVIAVESWDESLEVELKFRLIGKYKSSSSAIEHLGKAYIFNASEIDQRLRR